MNIRRTSPARSAFTLIEILVVLTIISILIAFTIPAIEPALKGSKLKQAGDDLEAALATARQVAITTSIPVEFRFFYFDDEQQVGTEKYYRSYQAVQLLYNPSKPDEEPEVKPVTDVITFPGNYVISEDDEYSTLVTNQQLIRGSGVRIPRSESADFFAFQFGARGGTNLITLTEANWTVTVMEDRYAEGSTGLPPEFITLEVDAFNGQVRKFQF